jgi:hypothetical protein
MKPNAINQEILLINGTSFMNRPFCRNGTDNAERDNVKAMEEIEKACWNGMLGELLPELAGHPSAFARSFIWNIVSGEHFLCISMGSCPMPGKDACSLDPYFFLSAISYN